MLSNRFNRKVALLNGSEYDMSPEELEIVNFTFEQEKKQENDARHQFNKMQILAFLQARENQNKQDDHFMTVNGLIGQISGGAAIVGTALMDMFNSLVSPSLDGLAESLTKQGVTMKSLENVMDMVDRKRNPQRKPSHPVKSTDRRTGFNSSGLQGGAAPEAMNYLASKRPGYHLVRPKEFRMA